jgi:DNA-binding Lrp family transcriptional regulator
MALDRIDFDILAALQNDGRLTNKELAGRVGLAPSSCLARVQRLRESGSLRGSHAEVDPAVLGIGLQALLAVRLRQHSRDVVDAFRRYVRTVPEVTAVYHLTGAQDFLVHVAVRDANHLRDLALDAFTTRAEVAHIETSLIFDYVRVPRLPDYHLPRAPPPPPKRARRAKR